MILMFVFYESTNVWFLRNLFDWCVFYFLKYMLRRSKTFVELKMRQTNLSFGEAQLLCNLQTFCFSETCMMNVYDFHGYKRFVSLKPTLLRRSATFLKLNHFPKVQNAFRVECLFEGTHKYQFLRCAAEVKPRFFFKPNTVFSCNRTANFLKG